MKRRTLASGSAVAVIAAAFLALLALHAVSTRVAREGYFTGVLQSSEVFRRLYDDLLLDPEFAPEVDELLGGVNIKREEVVATIKQLVKPEYLEATANAVIGHLVAHFDGDAKLELSFDITEIVHNVHRIALDALARGLAAVPVKPAASYEEFRGELENFLGALGGDGTIPTAIPTFAVTPEQRAEVAELLAAATGDNETVAKAMANDDVAGAIRAAASSVVEKLIALSIDRLTHNAYVVEIAEPDGPHYILGPGEEITAKVDRKLALIRSLNRVATTGRIVAALVVIAGLAALIALHRRDRRTQLAWIGAAFVAAGAVAFVAWYIARGIAEKGLGDVAASKSLPAALRAILGDVVTNSIGNFTPGFWVPALVAIVFGAGLFTLRSVVRR